MSAYSNMILNTPGLVSYWRLGESSGSFVDAKNAHNGTGTSVGYSQAGLLAKDADTAALFDADGDKIAVADHTDFATADVTVEAWFNAASWANNRPIIGRRSAANAGGYTLNQTSNTGELIWYVVLSSFRAISATGFDVGTTWHVVATYADGFQRLYRNGVEVAVSSDLGDLAIDDPASALVEIGHSMIGDNVSFRGTIDEVAIYNVALSPATVLAHYTMGANGPASGQIRIRQQFQLRPY